MATEASDCGRGCRVNSRDGIIRRTTAGKGSWVKSLIGWWKRWHRAWPVYDLFPTGCSPTTVIHCVKTGETRWWLQGECPRMREAHSWTSPRGARSKYMDFLEKHGCVINLKERVLHFKGVDIPLQNTSCAISQGHGNKRSVSLVETVKIPPYSELETLASADIAHVDGIWCAL